MFVAGGLPSGGHHRPEPFHPHGLGCGRCCSLASFNCQVLIAGALQARRRIPRPARVCGDSLGQPAQNRPRLAFQGQRGRNPQETLLLGQDEYRGKRGIPNSPRFTPNLFPRRQLRPSSCRPSPRRRRVPPTRCLWSTATSSAPLALFVFLYLCYHIRKSQTFALLALCWVFIKELALPSSQSHPQQRPHPPAQGTAGQGASAAPPAPREGTRSMSQSQPSSGKRPAGARGGPS